MFQKILSFLFILFLLASADVIKLEYQIKEAPKVDHDGIVYIEKGRSALYAYGPQVAVRTVYALLPLGQKPMSAPGTATTKHSGEAIPCLRSPLPADLWPAPCSPGLPPSHPDPGGPRPSRSGPMPRIPRPRPRAPVR